MHLSSSLLTERACSTGTRKTGRGRRSCTTILTYLSDLSANVSEHVYVRVYSHTHNTHARTHTRMHSNKQSSIRCSKRQRQYWAARSGDGSAENDERVDIGMSLYFSTFACTKTLKSYVCTHQPSNTHAPAHVFSPTLPQIPVGMTTPSTRQKMVAIQQTGLCFDEQHTCPCTPTHSNPHSTHISRKLHTASSTKNGRQPTNVRVCVDKYCIFPPYSITFALLLTFALILTHYCSLSSLYAAFFRTFLARSCSRVLCSSLSIACPLYKVSDMK